MKFDIKSSRAWFTQVFTCPGSSLHFHRLYSAAELSRCSGGCSGLLWPYHHRTQVKLQLQLQLQPTPPTILNILILIQINTLQQAHLVTPTRRIYDSRLIIYDFWFLKMIFVVIMLHFIPIVLFTRSYISIYVGPLRETHIRKK